MLRVVSSTSAEARLESARRFLNALSGGSEALIVGASRGAADNLARSVAASRGAAFGLARASLTELAARIALMGEGMRTASGDAGAEAIAAKTTFDALAAGELIYFKPVASMPGFAKALSRTLHELRLAGVPPDDLRSAGAAGADLSRLLERVARQLDELGVNDRSALLRSASKTWAAGEVSWAATPLVLLDVTVDSRAEGDFVAALDRTGPAGACDDSRGRQAGARGVPGSRRHRRGICRMRRRPIPTCSICAVSSSRTNSPPSGRLRKT